MRRSRPLGIRALLLVTLPLALCAIGVTPARAADANIIPDELAKAEAAKKKAAEEAAKAEAAAKKDKKKAKKKAAKPKDGWHKSLKAGFNFAFSQNQGVVGITDGVTIALGLQLDGGLLYRKRTHEWVNKLYIIHTETKIPNIEPFIKAADQLELSSFYTYQFPKFHWLGLFAGLKLQTALLPGSLVKDSDATLAITELDKSVTNATLTSQKAYRLTGAFSPLLFKQFVGGLAKPLTTPWMAIDIKLGIGAVEVWTSDGLVVKDDKGTADLLELNRLQDYAQGGVELQVGVAGVLANKLLSYGLFAQVMYPFAHNAETDLKGAELINAEFKFTLSVKLFSWAALNYSLAVLRTPLIVDEWQVTNSLMLSITANLVK